MADLCMHELHRCTICEPVVTPATPTDITNSALFQARWESTCAACDFTINPGDLVRFRNDRLIHADNRGCDR